MWHDPNIWISHSHGPGYGVTDGNNRDIGITDLALSNTEIAAATLVHELAHTNLAPGPPSRLAELALRSCGFAAIYDETIVGEFWQRPRSPRA